MELKKNKFLNFVLIFVGLAVLSAINTQMTYLAFAFLLVALIMLPIQYGFSLLIISSCFYTLLERDIITSVAYVLLAFVLMFKSILLSKAQRWQNLPKIVKCLIVLLVVSILIAPLIISLVRHNFDLEAYCFIVFVTFILIFLYFTVGKINLNKFTHSIALGLILSLVVGVILNLTSLLPSISVKSSYGNLHIYGLMYNADALLGLSIAVQWLLILKSMREEKYILDYILIFSMVVIGFVANVSTFILLEGVFALGLIIFTSLISKDKAKWAKKFLIFASVSLVLVGILITCYKIADVQFINKFYKEISYSSFAAAVILPICLFAKPNFDHEVRDNVDLLKTEFYLFVKRLFDIVVSFVAIVILIVPMMLIALVIAVFSRIPPIIRIKRVGKDGKIFTLYKYRSMFVDAESRLEHYLTKEQIEIWKREHKLDNDPRITKIGRFIRKTSLDELPQLFNILFGHLSIIGNRPLSQMEYDTHFNEEEKELLNQMRPGLTGYWQVYGRSNVTFLSGKRQEMYTYYSKHASIWLDIKIFFKTFIVVLFRKGAK